MIAQRNPKWVALIMDEHPNTDSGKVIIGVKFTITEDGYVAATPYKGGTSETDDETDALIHGLENLNAALEKETNPDAYTVVHTYAWLEHVDDIHDDATGKRIIAGIDLNDNGLSGIDLRQLGDAEHANGAHDAATALLQAAYSLKR